MTRFGYSVASTVLGLAGVALLWRVDWRIALGVFLVTWGNNIGQGLLR